MIYTQLIAKFTYRFFALKKFTVSHIFIFVYKVGTYRDAFCAVKKNELKLTVASLLDGVNPTPFIILASVLYTCQKCFLN